MIYHCDACGENHDSDYRPGHPLPNGESVCEESLEFPEYVRCENCKHWEPDGLPVREDEVGWGHCDAIAGDGRPPQYGPWAGQYDGGRIPSDFGCNRFEVKQ